MAVDWLALYLDEDVGAGDITSDSLLAPDARGSARIVAKERCVVAGLAHAAEVFSRLGAQANAATVKDGAWIEAGAIVLTIDGPSRAILTGERVALNIVSRMSGIATQTRLATEELARACLPAVVAGTRKTTPGFRAFEKEAIRIGGGDGHRMGLWDEAMVKDNHRAAAGSVAAAVEKIRATHPGKVVSCEVESLDDALAAAAAGAHWLLIDNQPANVGRAWAEAVWQRHPGVRIEASGGITPDRVLEFGWADRISMGWLTQKAPAADFSLEWMATEVTDG